MANRVTNNEVKVIVETSIADVTTPFIDNAHLLVEEELLGLGLSEARLKMIEMYLAAHYVSLAPGGDGNLLRSKTGQSEDEYAGNFSEGLALTRYGQQAISLDTSGTLANMATTGKRAEFRVV
jgi:hypothetical protein